MKDKLDTTDRAVLNLLQANSRLTIKELATQLNLSTTPVFERIKRLEKNNFITGYVALINHAAVGKKLHAFIDISIKDHSNEALEQFVQQIISYDEVLQCHHLSGQSDFLLQVVVADMAEYNQFILEKLSTVKNIGKVESRFSLSIRKQTNMIKL